MSQLKLYLVPVIVLVLLASYGRSQSEGEPCTTSYTGAKGICRLAHECSTAAEQNAIGIRPTICGYTADDMPVVCCENVTFASPSLAWNSPAENNQRMIELAQQKCAEYTRLAEQTIAALPLVVDPEPVISTTSTCNEALPLIVGGTKAMPGEFPHMVLIGFGDGERKTWNCGGSLISDRYVVTAAHCTWSKTFGEPTAVRLGEQNIASDDDGAHPIDIAIESVIKHPDYKPPVKYNDIALLKLTRRVPFNDAIRPACLWTSPSVADRTAIATGWGQTSYADHHSRSDDLLKVNLNVIDNQYCKNYHKDDSKTLPKGLLNSMICAGELSGGKDTCQGDSGSPLQVTSANNSCIFHIIGITSFGKGCAERDSPGVYTRISEFVPWIAKTIWS